MVQSDGPQAGAEPRVDVIVVAAGSSSRMAGIDKRLALLGGRPLLIRTLEAMAGAAIVDRIVLVMEEGTALETLRPGLPPSVVQIVPGGPHRGASESGHRGGILDLIGSLSSGPPRRRRNPDCQRSSGRSGAGGFPSGCGGRTDVAQTQKRSTLRDVRRT